MACNAGPDIIEDGLVLCLDAANPRSYPKSGTTWSDLKGGNNGTLTNMTASNFSSDNGGALSFDGSNEYVDFGSDPASSIRGTSHLTFSAWVKKTSSNSDCILGAWRYDGTWGFFMQWYSNNMFYVGASNGGNVWISTPLSWTDEWYHLSLVYDGTQGSNYTKCNHYVNGDYKAATGQSGSIGSIVSTSLADFRIGGLQNYSSYTNGLISNVLLYNRTLSPEEIRQNYLTTRHRFGV